MDKVIEIIKKKPLVFLIISIVYALGIGVVKLGIPSASLKASAWPWEAGLYFAGAILGVYFLDGAEVFFRVSPSPFRSIVFMAAFAVVSFFIVTSSGSFVASGLVLSLYLSLILRQVGEMQIAGNLNSWYRMVAGSVSISVQRWILFVFIAFFVLETVLFIR